MTVVLEHDRFDIRFDPAVVTVDRMLETVRAKGYEPAVVPDGGEPAAAVREIDPATLSDSLRGRFEEARRAGLPLLIDVSGPG